MTQQNLKTFDVTMELTEAEQELAKVQKLGRENPVAFFEQVLNVKLDLQQAKLVYEATKPGCRIMVKSARGTGKSFVITGLVFLFLLCFRDVNIKILSPSEQQLKQVFMREMRKHHSKMNQEIAKYFDIRTLSILAHKVDKVNEAHCATAGTDKTENVSGMHADKQIYLVDEASAISDEIYSTVLGSLGTAHGGGHFIGVSNPNRGIGSFYPDLFRKKPKGWQLLTFTAAKCSMIPQTWIDEMLELYGEDSDEYRVSVLGKFPRADGSVFIPESLVEEAEERLIPPREYNHERIVMGVDIARSLSGDKTVFTVRQGYKLLEIVDFKTDDTTETVTRMFDVAKTLNVDTIYGDATGVGGPVLDQARVVFQREGVDIPIVDVVVANRSKDPVQYFNVRAQLWGEMRDWLSHADIPKHFELKAELSSMTWGYSGKMQIQLTSKRQLKSKGIVSPDYADSLSLTMYDKAVTSRRRRTTVRNIKRRNYLYI